MELNISHYQRIADCFPRQRGNVSMSNLAFLNAIASGAFQPFEQRRQIHRSPNYTKVSYNVSIIPRCLAKYSTLPCLSTSEI